MTRDPLDRLLDEWKLGEPSPDLAHRIVARSREVEQLGTRTGWRARLAGLFGGGLFGDGMGGRLAPQMAAVGLALMIGFWYGAGGVASSTAQEIDASPLILGPNYETEWLG
ncbi:hypothetical protein [Desertibaculum subflavum]|uniref:hypothetical protein n=1 Tax=Desertibaculum subflavum TaxID=2268458 RepID=UPI000E6745B8